MASNVVAAFVSFAFGLGVLVLCTFALTVAFLRALQLRFYLAGLRRRLVPARRRRYNDRGLEPRKRRLRLQTDEEAIQLLSAGTSWTADGLPRWTAEVSRRVEIALDNPEVLPDMRGEPRALLKRELLDAALDVEHRWSVAQLALCLLAGLIVVNLFQYDALRIFSALGSGMLLLPTSVFALPDTAFHPDGSIQIRHVIGVLITALACGTVTSVLLRHIVAASDRRQSLPPPGSAAQASRPSSVPAGARQPEPGVDRIGRADHPIRAINFSSGGFDALMQLGVIHALVVIQGRVPDVVVGLSSGAINAAALAEVLQAGEGAERAALGERCFADLGPGEEALAVSIQNARLRARVKLLRQYIEAAQRAPERLLDALLPDAYQIDDAHPLAPLQQPRFAIDERIDRADFISTRSGLARLYNHLLDVPLSFGTIAKAIRRVLGIVASAEVPSFARRWAIRLTEGMRLWVMLGLNLAQVSTLVPIVLRAYRKRHRKPLPGTAATLIFRSRFLSACTRVLWYALSFFGLYLVWVSGSLFALPAYTLVALAIWIHSRTHPGDASTRGVVLDAWQGLSGWMLLTLAWTLVPLFLATSIVPFFMTFSEALAEAGSHWQAIVIGVVVLFLLVLGVTIWVIQRTRGHPEQFRERFLASYDLGQAIFRDHGLRTYLTELFDPAYYRKPTMNAAVEAALRRQYVPFGFEAGLSMPKSRKTVSCYHSAERLPGERIHLGLAVANTEKSSLDVVPDDALLIEGLMAATAMAPLLPPVELETRTTGGTIRKTLYIDGSNVSREPTHALLKLLRERRHEKHGPVHIYSVSPFPLSRPEMESQANAPAPEKGQYLDLLDIAWRAWRLKRFRDASLERRLTELITDLVPIRLNEVNPPDDKPFLRAWVTPIELERDVDINRRIWGANKEDRRRIIEEAIADGCRAALQVMIPHSLPERGSIKCRKAVAAHFGALAGRGLPPHLQDLRFPGSEAGDGSGIAEICARCSLNPERNDPDAAQSLERGDWQTIGPSWPHERQRAEPVADTLERFRPHRPARRKELDEAWESYLARDGVEKWPRSREREEGGDRKQLAGNERATVSLLFSGGVFRGVFQVGVLNALNELRIQPDLIAGASVGSITAAMVARAFAMPDEERAAHIARIAGVYLSIDRLILTDRFADGVRNLTLRAADMRFSIRQADRVFRKYDYPGFFEFDRNTRRVLAGIERLLYVSPYQLNDLVRSVRTRDNRAVTHLLKAGVQQFLNRMEIGEEALGAEPLRELIEHFVIQAGADRDVLSFTTDQLREAHGIQFLATTTNLTDGRLEVIGESPQCGTDPGTILEQALLASSAFPAVFRPRWSWELTGGASRLAQYIDGGVMDNLPMDAIARFLNRAGRLGMIRRFPATPHLIVGASLEVQTPTYQTDFIRRRFGRSWLALHRRARQLGYNTKLDTYEFAENALRSLYHHALEKYPHEMPPRAAELIGIRLLPIKPNWLCGTFAFHPMLGFRRERQARSIAHGCAITLLHFAAARSQYGSSALKDWGVADARLPPDKTWTQLLAQAGAPEKRVANGKCWLRDCECPFSRQALGRKTLGLEQAVVDEVSAIHRLCAQRETHLRLV